MHFLFDNAIKKLRKLQWLSGSMHRPGYGYAIFCDTRQTKVLCGKKFKYRTATLLTGSHFLLAALYIYNV